MKRKHKKGFILAESILVLGMIAVMSGGLLTWFINFKKEIDPPKPDYTILLDLGYTEEEIKVFTYDYLIEIPLYQKEEILKKQGIDTEKLTDEEIDIIFEKVFFE